MNKTVVEGARKELSLVMVSVEGYLEDGTGLDIARTSLNKLMNLLIFIELREAAEVTNSISITIMQVVDKALVFEEQHWSALIDALVGLDSFLASCSNNPEIVSKSLEYSREAISSLMLLQGDVSVSDVDHTLTANRTAQALAVLDGSGLSAEHEPTGLVELTSELNNLANETTTEAEQSGNELDDIDPEILDIFQEEVVEELEAIQSQYAIWKRDPTDKEAIETARRSFHTIKGSGNVVGATTLGGFAASGEALFGRVIVGQLIHSPGLLVLLDDFVATLATVIERLFSGKSLPLAGMSVIEERAINFPQGEQATPVTASSASAADQEPDVVALVESDRDSESDEQAQPDDIELFCSMEDGLYEIFVPESNLHIDTIRAFIESANESPQTVTAELATAIHTLHGSSRLAGAEAMTALSDVMEGYCSSLLKLSAICDSGSLELLSQYSSTMREAVCAINTPLENAPEWSPLYEEIKRTKQALISSIAEQENGTVAAENSAQMDASVFLVKAIGNMAELHESFAAWTASSDCSKARANFGVALNKFRTNVEVAQLTDMANLILLMESMLNAAPNFDPKVIAHIHEGLSCLEDALDTLYLEQPFTGLEQIIDKLQGELDSYKEENQEESETETVAVQDQVDLRNESNKTIETVDEEEADEDFDFLEFDFIDTDEEIDPEVLELFLEEAGELVDQLEEAYGAWLLDTSSIDAMDAQLRHLHTLKGNALVANLRSLGGLGHLLESLFERLVSGEQVYSEKLSALIRAAFDGIHTSVSRLAKDKPRPQLQPLIDAVKAAILGQEWGDYSISDDTNQDIETGDAHDGEARVEVELEPVGISVSSEQAEEPAFDGNLIRAEAPAPLQAEKDVGEDQRVRVLSSALDKLINISGEISITQTHLDIQQSKDKYNLLELKTTIARLQRQLGTLNLETEAQIISRHQGEHSEQHDASFDPLEMDRYSTLQQITRSITETVDDLSEIGDILDKSSDETDSLMLKASLAARDVRDGLQKTLMIPLVDQFTRFQRVVRMAAQGEGKEVELEMLGGEGHIERNLLEKMVAPIEHLLRNAVAHGIELPDVREGRLREGCKPRQGKIQLSFAREVSYMEIVVSDDGAGINTDLIREAAIQRGMLEPDTEISDNELYQYIMAPGFSTISEVSAIAGRGVGMDVVMEGIQKLGGSIVISSELGKGTRFTIRLPAMLSLVESLMIEVADEVYAIPHGGVDSVIKMRAADVVPNYEQENPSLEYEGKIYELYYLGSMLGLSAPPSASAVVGEVPLLLAQVGSRAVAVQVDYLIGTSKIQVIPIGDQFKRFPWFVDGTLLSSGKIALLLDVKTLLRERETQPQLKHDVIGVAAEKKPNIMIVDDSITLRKITSRIFERQNMDVVTAKDGVEAVAMLQEHIPDVMLLDVEMPRMNGYELAQQMGNSDLLKDIPIIMITSRTGEKHKQRGLELGVRYYLGKPFHEPELLECVHKLLEEKSNG
ncbi:MAG: Hpt domain-containing protein [Pseudomonadales bacterium]|nr:Hpt domain-containing protein [Pseudomonadales bacterium]